MEFTPDSNTDRVRAHTAPAVLDRIDRATRGAVARAVEAGDPEAIRHRLAELDREWDVDRAVMVFFSVAASLSFQLGRRWKRGFFALLQTQIAILGLHATVGWCPPAALLRRLGFRTAPEIAAEREALHRLLWREERGAIAH